MTAHAIAPRLLPRAEQVYMLTGGPTTTREGVFARASEMLDDLAILLAAAVCLPLVIIGVGLPIALLMRGVLWIVGAL